MPVLDGSGLLANDFPQGHTPNCGYEVFPKPILAGCTEPLPEGATDMRGLWIETRSDGSFGHMERIEQCGNRYVVTAAGVIHDMTTDGLLAGASDDVRPLSVGPLNLCIRTSATTEWIDGRLQFEALGLVPVVTRYMEGEKLKWEYPSRDLTKLSNDWVEPPKFLANCCILLLEFASALPRATSNSHCASLKNSPKP